MDEKEFLIYLNSLTIDSSKSNITLNKTFELLKQFCECDEIVWNFSRRKYDYKKEDFINKIYKNDIFILLDWGFVLLKNVRKNFEDKNYFFRTTKCILNNIFNNHKLINQLKDDKYIDSMLKIHNRAAYEDLLSEQKKFKNVSVSFIDADSLGVVNNKYGYKAGDTFLKTITNILKENFRYKDIYRIGGDEIVVICNNIDRNLFENKMKKVIESVSKTSYSLSYGIIHEEYCNDIELMVKKASILMKQKKELYRKTHPEKYINKYEVTSVDKIDGFNE